MPKSQRTQRRRSVQNRLHRLPPPIAKPKTRRNPTLTGIADTDGATVRFTADQVRFRTLRDREGRVVGISYPTKSFDDELRTWAGTADRTADRKYLPDYRSGDANRPGRFETTPWARTGESRPFYVHAHADPNVFDVTIRTRSGREEVVAIDGRNHAKLLEHNHYFQQAARQDPNRPLVYLSCESGNRRVGGAASGSANFLHRGGYRGNVYAPTGKGVRPPLQPGDRRSWYGVDPASDGGEGFFRRFPPPRRDST